MTAFDRIVLIFNPKSTGPAPQLAQELHDELTARLPDTEVAMSPTQHAGHGRDLARDAASTGRPLIVSVSGDGGYNEVVDGAMQAGNEEAVCAVMAAGNANDHRRTTSERPLADAIVRGEVHRIDLLALTIGTGPEARTQFAHSYIGVGLTPVVAVDLEKGSKGSLREIVSVVRTFARFRPFTIQLEDGTKRSFDSLVLANIAQMAKHATLSESGSPEDGRFEVVTVRHTAKWRVLGVALKAATRGLGPQPTATHYGFTTLKPTPVQLDGEVLELDAQTTVSIDIAPRALATIT
ncbi:diacylglycerol/lipid kinase family protein [Ornithinimicrobium cryptoxanthini]|uniref:Diacylglycerol kinase n=1 Tax=Ornithinimicrobium cryptoxanthini TaxID=2934161 RepID=A0ABY4YET1_9MICO|nr:diacylglycerol kinase family protein [Ornithinimicrobium cryptoxanthini]USQ74765.1 diacylglycerol kinase [Ornithinimicrobium cryptoxanthini]